MDPNEIGLTHFYHHNPHHHPLSSSLSPFPPPSTAAAASPASNGLYDGANAAALYAQSVAGKTPAAMAEPMRRKRGRPRKYNSPEEAAAAKKAAVSSRLSSPPGKKKEEQCVGGGSNSSLSSGKSSQLRSSSNGAQSFTAHLINVPAGNDVAQKIMLFMQQERRELCILSASGSISNASLQQPATSGGSVTYEGCFDIISLSGSFVRTDLGGRTGGLSACLCSSDGQIVGGGVGGPLIAAGPVEVIVATFVIDPKKDSSSGMKGGDNAANQMPSPARIPSSTGVYMPAPVSSVDHQNMGPSPFIIQPHSMQVSSSQSTDWRTRANYQFMGNTVHEAHESSESGDYDD